jgi:non-canonical purine NTP pyrophosphatase, rdgB/HAM1 family
MKLLFATGNEHKVIEAQKALGEDVTLIMPKELGFLGDIPENGCTLEDNAEEKCRYLWNMFHESCFADDTGLEVEALNGAPGVYTARYGGESKDPDANMNKLLHELSGITDITKRKARFRTVVALIINDVLYKFEGVLNGYIALSKSGIQGFGYDPIFIPEGKNVTLAEISLDEKNSISHRGKAMRALKVFLDKQK